MQQCWRDCARAPWVSSLALTTTKDSAVGGWKQLQPHSFAFVLLDLQRKFLYGWLFLFPKNPNEKHHKGISYATARLQVYPIILLFCYFKYSSAVWVWAYSSAQIFPPMLLLLPCKESPQLKINLDWQGQADPPNSKVWEMLCFL